MIWLVGIKYKSLEWPNGLARASRQSVRVAVRIPMNTRVAILGGNLLPSLRRNLFFHPHTATVFRHRFALRNYVLHFTFGCSFLLARSRAVASSGLPLRLEFAAHAAHAEFSPPSFAPTAHHLRSPSRHTTFVRLLQHLRRISRRDKPSRYGSFEQLHLGHPTFVEDSGPPPPSVRLRQHLRRISRRDKPSRYDSFEKLHFGHTTRRPSGMIGLWARPTPPHHLGSSIGQAFHAPPAAA
jgi:hypothetical protein